MAHEYNLKYIAIKMKYNEILEQVINEINMSPNSLRSLAKNINAKAGMEFEMYVPDTAGADEDYDLEPDYDANESTRSFSQIEDFFADGDYNSRRDVRSMIESMREKFYEWIDEKIYEDWQEQEADLVYSWVVENVQDEDILDYGNYEDDDREKFAEDPEFRKKVITDYVDNAVEKVTDDYDSAREEFADNARGDADEEEWLDKEFPTMLDVSGEFDISWPHYYNPDSGDTDISTVAASFEEEIGKPVTASSNYHSAERNDTDYIVEPDGSLDQPDNSSDGGLEFISPPMPVDEMFSDMDKIVNWANNYGCYTNASTGLHMNVSVPGMSKEKLDYVKLALLMGDEYVLEKFERLGNYFAKSAMKIVRERVAQRPEDATAMLEQMKNHLGEMATKIIHSGETNKYTSINTKEGYIEFRSPGGDWLASYNEDKGNIENTMLRFVVALDAAMDPEKYRNEYLKKLYKLLAPKGENDTLAYFAKFAAGELPSSALKSFIRQAQLERKGIKDTYNELQPASGQKPNYFITNTATDEVVKKYYAASNNEAYDVLVGYKAQNPGEYTYGKIIDAASAQTPATGGIKYDLYNTTTDQVYRTFYAANDAMALDMGTRYRQEYRDSTNAGVLIGVRRTVAAAPAAAQSTGGEFSGQWLVKDAQGREIHRFGGIGNSQSDANRVAMQWLRDNPSQMTDGIEVVPEMR